MAQSDDTVLAHVTPPMPVDAFTAGLLLFRALMPEDALDSDLVVSADDDNQGGFTVIARGTVDVSRAFKRGHFEVRWVDTPAVPGS